MDVSANLKIGNSPTEYFHGKMDEIRIYSRALSDTEIGLLHTASD
ncbi:MAG: hypothetical protein H7A25_16690 [Leptospiraceae bacterium]|nr:hypothetical protein [Leptospiraceae bacterium]